MQLPEAFTSYTKQLMGDELYQRLATALDGEPPVSVRINAAKGAMAPDNSERVAWCPYGYYLQTRPAFTFDPLLHAGLYYVQEASSMFLHHVLAQYVDEPVAMLDMCAAPGGKTTTALGALPEGSVMLCNEPVRQRAQVLAENIQKWGNANVIVTNNYPRDIAATGLRFQVVLCDVPCSGEGMFRKDSGAVGEWSRQNVEHCRQLQREIVSDAWLCLDAGGLLVYSTCTFNAAENEENVAWICRELGAELLSVDIEPSWGIHCSLLPDVAAPVYRFLPGLTRGEGLFMAVMRKTDDDSDTSLRRQKRNKQKTAQAKAPQQATEWLADSTAFETLTRSDTIIAIPRPLLYIYNNVETARLRIVHAGVTLGTQRGRDIVPTQSLALSTGLHRGAFPEAELSYNEAISYLRKEAITLPASTPRGFALTTYKGHPLGFVKNLGNRANNLYPQEWKIKSGHLPNNEFSRNAATSHSLWFQP